MIYSERILGFTRKVRKREDNIRSVPKVSNLEMAMGRSDS